MKNKIFIRTTIDNHCEQCIDIQPTADCSETTIEVYVREMDNSKQYGPLYLNEQEVEVLYNQLKQMLIHIKSPR